MNKRDIQYKLQQDKNNNAKKKAHKVNDKTKQQGQVPRTEKSAPQGRVG
jgi:hypothetical protein